MAKFNLSFHNIIYIYQIPQALISSERTCELRPLAKSLRPSCLQLNGTNCPVSSEICSDAFVNLKAGLLVNTAVQFKKSGGQIRVSTATTQLLKWTDVSEVFVDHAVFKAPDNFREARFQVLYHPITSDSFMNYMMTEKSEEEDMEISVALEKNLWHVKTSLNKFVRDISGSPFFSHAIAVICISIFCIFCAPLLIELIKCAWSRTFVSTNTLAGRVQSVEV